MSDATETTTPEMTSQLTTANEALKVAFPDLVYERIAVDNARVFEPFGRHTSWYGWEGFVKIDDEIVAIAEIVDDTSLIIGRKPS